MEELYSNMVMTKVAADYYSREIISYSDYFMDKLADNYLGKLFRAIPHNWRLGIFVQNVNFMLESNWLGSMLDGVDLQLLESPLQACGV